MCVCGGGVVLLAGREPVLINDHHAPTSPERIVSQGRGSFEEAQRGAGWGAAILTGSH